MEIRKTNVIIQSPGGTAGKNSDTFKLALPSSWMKQLGISRDDREVELNFDGQTIKLYRRPSLQDFINKAMENGHNMILFSYYNGDSLCTQIAADYSAQVIRAENHTENIIKSAFGNNISPSWNDFNDFLESRCVPRSRAGISDYLKALDLYEYDPLSIIEKTEGRMEGDDQWLKMEVLKWQ